VQHQRELAAQAVLVTRKPAGQGVRCDRGDLFELLPELQTAL
jgi:hypothetical protein